MRKPFPRRTFLNTDLRLADFFEKAGSVMFENWHVPSTFPSPEKNESETEKLVKSAIIEALCEGRLLAIFFLLLIDPAKRALPEVEERRSLDECLLDDFSNEAVSDRPTMTYGPTGPFYVDQTYWLNSETRWLIGNCPKVAFLLNIF